MQKSDVQKKMEQYVGGGSFISLIELTRFLGRKDPKVVKRDFLAGLDRLGTRYFIPDVTAVLISKKGVS